MTEKLTLKWGTLKGWSGLRPETVAILQRYADGGYVAGAMQQQDSAAQKELLCKAIDGLEGKIVNDWSGETMTKDEAKEYVRSYQI